VSSDGDFYYEYHQSILKVDASTGAAVAGVTLAASHVFNNLGITWDNKYLLYTTGALIGPPTADAMD